MTSRRRRRRAYGGADHVLVILGYLALLVALLVIPGWAALPWLTPAAATPVRLLSLLLVLGLVGQVLALAGLDPRWRYLVRYVAALVVLALVGDLWSAAAIDFGSTPEAWVGALRMVLVLVLAWDVVIALRAAVGVVRGRRMTRLAPGAA